MENTKTFTKTFKGEFKPRHYYSPINVTIVVDFIGIESQQELDNIIDNGDCYNYIVKNIVGRDDECNWIELKDECLYDTQACKIDTIISDALYYEELERTNINL